MRPLRHTVNLINAGKRYRWHPVDAWQCAVRAAAHQGFWRDEQEMI